LLPVRLLANPSYELDSLSGVTWWAVNGIGGSGGVRTLPGWQSTHPTYNGVVQPLELWGSGLAGYPSNSGSKHIELNYVQSSAVYQDLCVLNGETVPWSTYHRGRGAVETMKVTIAPVSLWGTSVLPPAGVSYDSGGLSDGGTAWGLHSGTWTNSGATGQYRFAFSAVSPTGGTGNLVDDSNVTLGALVEFDPAAATVNPTTSTYSGTFYRSLRLSGTAGSPMTVNLTLDPTSTVAINQFTVGAVYDGAGTVIPGATATKTATGVKVTIPPGAYDPNQAGGHISIEMQPVLGSTTTTSTLKLNITSVTGGSSTSVPAARVGSAGCTPPAITSSSVTFAAPTYDPKVVKTGPSTVTAGSAISYSVQVTNSLSQAALPGTLTVTDSPPSALSGSWTCSAAGGATCPSLGTGSSLAAVIATGLSPSGVLTFTFTGTVSSAQPSGALTNTAALTIPSTYVDADLLNNVSSTTAALTGLPDVAVVKTGTTGPVASGTAATWTVTVTNTRDVPATNVSVTDSLPAGFTLNTMSSATSGVNCTLSSRTCTLASLAGGASFSVAVTATAATDVADTSSWTNGAVVTAAQDLYATNNTSSVVGTYLRRTDMTLTKSLVGPFIAGTVATYSLGA
jgi:uncharacterized repeat protein (TIGR01451 family)